MKPKPFLSFRWKLMIPLLIIFGSVLLLVYTRVDESLEQLASNVFEGEIRAVANQAKGCIDPEILQAAHQNAGDNQAADGILGCFEGVVGDSTRTRLVTYFENADGQFEIGVNSRAEPNRLYPGEVLTADSMARYFGEFSEDAFEIEALLQTGLEQAAFQPGYFIDEADNLFYVGYFPIQTDAREPAAGLIVYQLGSQISEDIADFQFRLYTGMGLAFLFIIFFLFMFTGRTTASLRKLEKAAEQISGGDYEQAEMPKTVFVEDEVIQLAQVFNQMVEEVYGREKQLVEQVTELKIFIDEDRRKEELEEVISSDFFRELQAKRDQLKKVKLAQSGD